MSRSPISSARHLKLWAEQVLAVKKRESEIKEAEAYSQLRNQYAIALESDHCEGLNSKAEVNRLRVAEIESLKMEEVRELQLKEETLKTEVKHVTDHEREKCRLLRQTLFNELQGVRRKLQADYDALDDELKQQLRDAETIRKEDSRRLISQSEARVRENERDLVRSHETGAKRLHDHFSSLLREHQSEISKLENEITELSKIRERNRDNILELEHTNQQVLQPLEALKIRERKLLEQARIADAGFMAYNNFKQLLRKLRAELSEINRKIDAVKSDTQIKE